MRLLHLHKIAGIQAYDENLTCTTYRRSSRQPGKNCCNLRFWVLNTRAPVNGSPEFFGAANGSICPKKHFHCAESNYGTREKIRFLNQFAAWDFRSAQAMSALG